MKPANKELSSPGSLTRPGIQTASVRALGLVARGSYRQKKRRKGVESEFQPPYCAADMLTSSLTPSCPEPLLRSSLRIP
jgi:hypothetical protein